MKTRLWILLLIALIMLPIVNPLSRPAAAQSTAQPTAQAATQPAVTPLLDLLTFVPNAASSATSSGLILSYVDHRAAEKAANVTRPTSGAAFAALTDDQRLPVLRAYGRFMVGPPLDTLLMHITEMPHVVGFDWFDTDQAVLFGDPPSQAVVYSGQYDTSKINAALTARQFDKTTIDNTSVWLAETGQTTLIKAMLDAHSNTLTSLAFAPDYRALFDALVVPGTPIQALFIAPSAVQIAGASANTTLRPLGVLPPYTLAAIADYQDGDTQITVLAVLYTDPDTAMQASAELFWRVDAFDQIIKVKSPATVEVPDVFTEHDISVARIRVKYVPAPSTGLALPDTVFRRWIEAIYMRAFVPLAQPSAKR